MFNDEELLFLNRIAFYLLSKEGVSLHFNDFIKELKVLQDGKFEDQVDLILSMMMGGRSEQKMFIEIDSLICFVMSSMPQQRPMKTNVEELLYEQFELGFQQVKMNKSMASERSDLSLTSGKSLHEKKAAHMHRDDIKSIILDNAWVKSIFECVLQQNTRFN